MIGRYCIVIPHYEHCEQLQEFLPMLVPLGLACILVDDGSSQETKGRLVSLVDGLDFVTLLSLEDNVGKGGAFVRGIQVAAEMGYTHAIQLDADGQHSAAAVTDFLSLSEAFPEAIVSGWAQYGDDAPRARLIGRRFALFWVHLETMSLEIKDAMCGFRVYPIEETIRVCLQKDVGQGMQFDQEVLVYWSWEGNSTRFLKTPVQYPTSGRSHYRMFADNVKIVLMHIRLLFEGLFTLPRIVGKKKNRS